VDEAELGEAVGLCNVVGDAEVVFWEAKSDGEAGYCEWVKFEMRIGEGK